MKRKQSHEFLEKAQAGMEDWRELMVKRGTDESMPTKPQVIAHELGKRLPPNAIVTSNSGTNTTWWARQIPVKRGQMFSCSGNLASMACGVP
jgi:pyruvate dehydrogenase (quinone)/pyruvate oxidase